MKIIPIFHCADIRKSIDFYSRYLGFKLDQFSSPDDVVVDIQNGEAWLQLTSLSGDQKRGMAVNVLVDNVDQVFAELLRRGYKVPNRPESPVHQFPLDQTWGTREFYVTDDDGNTLRFRHFLALKP